MTAPTLISRSHQPEITPAVQADLIASNHSRFAYQMLMYASNGIFRYSLLLVSKTVPVPVILLGCPQRFAERLGSSASFQASGLRRRGKGA
jgi:hypothetical protein